MRRVGVGAGCCGDEAAGAASGLEVAGVAVSIIVVAVLLAAGGTSVGATPVGAEGGAQPTRLRTAA